LKRDKAYKTGAAFRTALEDRLGKIAMEEGVDLQRIRRQVSFDRLLARLGSAPETPWVLKGGYAMELRYQKARATKDLDFTMRLTSKSAPENDQVLALLQEAAAADMEDFFIYRIGQAIIDLDGAPYGGARYPVEAILGDRTFAKFHLDIGVGDIVMEPAEIFHSRDWLSFAKITAATIPIISREQQFAEKLHAYTLPRPQNPNSRVRDLVDMVLLVEKDQLGRRKTKEAILATFKRRGTHSIPSELQAPPKTWEKPFITLAAECELQISLDGAYRKIHVFFSSLKLSGQQTN
jgi:hypothetical protein